MSDNKDQPKKEEQPKKVVKPIFISDFPMLERTQRFFVEQTPMRSELMNYIHETNRKNGLTLYPEKWPAHCKIAKQILFNPALPIVFRTDLVDKYGHAVVDNIRSYMNNYIRMTSIQKIDHLAIIGWFVEQIVDIEATSKQNNWPI